jgi:hypothetical protein
LFENGQKSTIFRLSQFVLIIFAQDLYSKGAQFRSFLVKSNFGASLVWPKLVWPNARLAETHLAESPFGRTDPTGLKMAENFTKMD